RWADADRLIRGLKDPLLLGHVQAERYLSPNVHASYAELAAWLKRYGDLPGADEIYKLALKRKPRGAAPPHPTAPAVSVSTAVPADDAGEDLAQDRNIRALQVQMLGAIQSGRPEAAEQLLDQAERRATLDPIEYDSARAKLAAGYLYKGNSK